MTSTCLCVVEYDIDMSVCSTEYYIDMSVSLCVVEYYIDMSVCSGILAEQQPVGR